MINRALKLLRTFHQLSQVELAKRLGLSNSYLSELESGIKSPSIEILEQYSVVFKLPLSSILLFSEQLESATPGNKLKIKAADKVLKLLEWVAEKETIVHG